MFNGAIIDVWADERPDVDADDNLSDVSVLSFELIELWLTGKWWLYKCEHDEGVAVEDLEFWWLSRQCNDSV